MADTRLSHAIHTSAQTLLSIQQRRVAQEELRNEESESSLTEFLELVLFNPLVQANRFLQLKDLKGEAKEGKDAKEAKTDASEVKKVLAIEETEELANRFQRDNPELKSRTLLLLKNLISAKDTPDEALEKVLSLYPDPSLADEALDFLIESSDPSVLSIVQLAKDKLNAAKNREIIAGKNMSAAARAFSEEGLGNPTSLRDLYRDITGNQREPLKLFQELTELFSYDKLKIALKFLLHSLGSDLKAKGPSIPPGELKRLLDETRSLQGVIGIFRFFQSRMGLIQKLFNQSNLAMPHRLSFELLGKILAKLLAERYINADRIVQTAALLGISEELAAQLIIYAQMREALKQIAPRYFRNFSHREELNHAFQETLDNLEEKLEDDGDEDDEDERK
ncbi:MAG: negative regulator of type secretion [Chlamydiota bacterium]|jgi:type III secretion protein W